MRSSFFLILVIATFAASCFNLAGAKEAVKITPIEDLWKNALPKVKAVTGFEAAGKLRAAKRAGAQNQWNGLAEKLKAGQLKNLDTSGNKWQQTVTKLKAAGQLNKIKEAQVVKVTEDVAQQVAQNPSKWRYVKKALLITFGVGITGLIVVGLQSMMTSK